MANLNYVLIENTISHMHLKHSLIDGVYIFIIVYIYIT